MSFPRYFNPLDEVPGGAYTRAMAEKILVVEDEEDFRALLSGVLDKEGYSVVTASNGEDGIAAFQKEKPDLVILDVQLPDMEGFEICRKIRAEGPNPEVPVLFCTIRSAVAPVAEGLKAGATDYIIKPFATKDLLARIETALGRGGG
jgi:DNA-binding response OmpR family regulator